MIEGAPDGGTETDPTARIPPPLVTAGPPQAIAAATWALSAGPLVTGSAGVGEVAAASGFVESGSDAAGVRQDDLAESVGTIVDGSETEEELPLLMPWASGDEEPSAAAEASPELQGEELDLSEGDGEWQGDYELPELGAAAVDEPALEADSASSDEAEDGELGLEDAISAIGGSSSASSGIAAAEVAERLERIARTLRERGAKAALAEHGNDPLGAMITGYLIGISESAGPAEPLDRS